MVNHTKKQISMAVCTKIRRQFNQQPESRLVFAIVEKAIQDLVNVNVSPLDRRSAVQFLTGPMSPVVACGVDPDWIRETAINAGLPLDIDKIYQ